MALDKSLLGKQTKDWMGRNYWIDPSQAMQMIQSADTPEEAAQIEADLSQYGNNAQEHATFKQALATKAQQLAQRDQQNAAMAQKKQLLEQAQKQSQEYKAQMPAIQEREYGQVSDVSRRGLAQQMGDINKNANARGLLYSGLKQGEQANAQSNTASDLAAKRSDINAKTQATANRYEQLAAGQGLENQGMQLQNEQQQQSQNDSLYQQALGRRQESNRAAGEIGSAAGQLGGAAFGALSKPKKPGV